MILINFIAVLVAAVAAFIIGFLLHGPVLGKLWMRLANIHPTGKEKLSDMYPQMFWNLVVNIISALGVALGTLVLSSSVFSTHLSVLNGIIVGLVVWIFFIGTSTVIDVVWMGKSFKLWIYEMFCSLVVMVVVGLIIGSWSVGHDVRNIHRGAYSRHHDTSISSTSHEVTPGQQFNDSNNQIRFDTKLHKWVDNYGICHTCTPENGFPANGDIPQPPTSQPVACTMEAKLCPDGSAVGRSGPRCEFAPCPGE
ncbi:MAG: hypothetical protein RLY57_415 [Candidatus Parcubacteria bacterium]|jgi:hypothetical protein